MGVEGGSLPVRARFSAKPRIYMAKEISLKFADKMLASLLSMCYYNSNRRVTK